MEEEVITSEKQRFATYYCSGPANLTIASATKVTHPVITPRRHLHAKALLIELLKQSAKPGTVIAKKSVTDSVADSMLN